MAHNPTPMMHRHLAWGLCGLFLFIPLARAAPNTLDDFLSVATNVQDVKNIAMVILTQGDPAEAEHVLSQLRRFYWSARPDAHLSNDERSIAKLKLNGQWQEVRDVVQKYQIQSISFAGIDPVPGTLRSIGRQAGLK